MSLFPMTQMRRFKGVVRGGKVEINGDSGLSDGTEVVVSVPAVRGTGTIMTFGILRTDRGRDIEDADLAAAEYRPTDAELDEGRGASR